MFCPQCGSQLSQDVGSCAQCGFELSGELKPTSTEQPTSKPQPVSSVIDVGDGAAAKSNNFGRVIPVIIIALLLFLFFGNTCSKPQTIEDYGAKNSGYLNNMVSAYFINNDSGLQTLNSLGMLEVQYSVSGNQINVDSVFKIVGANEFAQLVQTYGGDSIIGSLIAGTAGSNSMPVRFVQQVEADTGIEGVALTWRVTDGAGNALATINANRNGTF